MANDKKKAKRGKIDKLPKKTISDRDANAVKGGVAGKLMDKHLK